jgi:hypothetical protein
MQHGFKVRKAASLFKNAASILYKKLIMRMQLRVDVGCVQQADHPGLAGSYGFVAAHVLPTQLSIGIGQGAGGHRRRKQTTTYAQRQAHPAGFLQKTASVFIGQLQVQLLLGFRKAGFGAAAAAALWYMVSRHTIVLGAGRAGILFCFLHFSVGGYGSKGAVFVLAFAKAIGIGTKGMVDGLF